MPNDLPEIDGPLFSREDLVGGAEAVGGVGFDAEPDAISGDEAFDGEMIAEVIFGAERLGLPPHPINLIEAGGEAEKVDAEGGIGPGAISTTSDGFCGAGKECEFPDVIDVMEVAAYGLKGGFGGKESEDSIAQVRQPCGG